MDKKFIVNVPVADLRAEPKLFTKHDLSHQNLRESQLLFGEQVELIEKSNGWLKIRALEQPYYNEEKGWHPYQGWVHHRELIEVPYFNSPHYVICAPTPLFSYGTYLETASGYSSKQIRPIPQSPNRTLLIQEAKLFLNAPYLWGGKASFSSHPPASVDCSGLIYLLFRAQGLTIPRDAHDQFLCSKPVQTLLPGDLLYLSKSERICHVILKIDEGLYIEAPESGKKVRLLTWNRDVWERNGFVYFRDRVSHYTPYPRSLFENNFLNL